MNIYVNLFSFKILLFDILFVFIIDEILLIVRILCFWMDLEAFVRFDLDTVVAEVYRCCNHDARR